MGLEFFVIKKVVNSLSSEVLKKYIYSHDNLYEVLWPISVFIDENSIEHEYCKLYKSYDGLSNIRATYFNTLKLIYISQMRYFELRTKEIKNYMLENFKKSINNLVINI